MGTSFGPQRPGGVFDEPEEEGAPTKAPRPPEIVENYDTHHLCLRCIHAVVCALPVAIRSLGADGQVIVSTCAAFVSTEDLRAAPPA